MSNWLERQNRREDFFSTIEQTREGLLSTLSDTLYIRELDAAKAIYQFTQDIFDRLKVVLEKYPSLESLYQEDYGAIKDLYDENALSEICFVDNSIYPENEQLTYVIEDRFSPELFVSNISDFDQWLEQKVLNHEHTQNEIKNKFDINAHTKNFKCQCVGCLADFRSTLRDTIYKQQIHLIDQTIERLFEKIVTHKIDDISDEVFNLRKKIEKISYSLRTKLRKGSLNKLDAEIEAYYKEKFDSKSELAKVYRLKLEAYFNSILVEEGVKPELISVDEYNRFFEQLHTNIWHQTRFLRKEFLKLIQAVTALKRKDISATILKDYLGQFWVHSEARRMKRKIVYHMGPTNSGKTYHAIEKLCSVKKGCYLAPLRLLASELYDTMNAKGVKTTLLTGEEVVEIDGATHYSSTIEMAKLHDTFDCVVIDEIQMITDPQRGWAWTRALVNMVAPEIHVCGDPSVLDLIKKILVLTGDEIEIKKYDRMTELKVMEQQITLSRLEKSDALIVFSRRNALKYKSDLERLDFKVSVVYGRLSPEVRREQARKFDMGETDIMVATDAIAMGMNLPVQRIVFSALSKFIDNKEIPLTFSEIKQIAGRAGRFKRFPVGHVTTLERVEDGIDTLKYAIASTLEQKDQCMVGPDLDIFNSVNEALAENGLPILSLSEFLRLFNTMTFQKPFYCVDLKEMIELAEMVEDIDKEDVLTSSEKFGFACAPVNLGLLDHVQYYVHILNLYVRSQTIENEDIDVLSDSIDYLETGIKCVELYQWLARHFNGKNFVCDEQQLQMNKTQAVEKLNEMLSERLHKNCSSCGAKMNPDFKFNICEKCFDEKRFSYRGRAAGGRSDFKSQPNASRDGRETADRPTKSFRPSGSASGGSSAKNKKAAEAFRKSRPKSPSKGKTKFR
jgi:ATP-dependent RNA helicase SUPV3L1/SUV3